SRPWCRRYPRQSRCAEPARKQELTDDGACTSVTRRCHLMRMSHLNRSAPRLRPGGLQRFEEHTMRILVAGATGAVGQYLVPALVAAGHSVIGTTRGATKREVVR